MRWPTARNILAAVALVVVASPVGAVAETHVAASGATVTFPIGTPERDTNAPARNLGRPVLPDADPLLLLFLATFDQDQGTPEDLKTLSAALRNREAWRVFAPESQQGFEFITMAFPDSLATSVWTEPCQPPAPNVRGFSCYPVKVGGVPGRQYLARTHNPLRPDDRSYLVLQVVVRKDRLYLLTYGGVEGGSGARSHYPSTSEQETFLKSLRFGDP